MNNMKDVCFKELRRMQGYINRTKRYGEQYKGELENMATYQLAIIEVMYQGGLINKNTYDIAIEVYSI